ncbi:hypothetical protein IG631_13078 [Alternaria alternata]|nr:hypothetical protein IG631_13078 [Alternaria alternata]
MSLCPISKKTTAANQTIGYRDGRTSNTSNAQPRRTFAKNASSCPFSPNA